MKKIMFVCMGNICRSPIAQAVFEHKLKERELEAHYEAESSGTHGYHVGEDADARMRKTAAGHGVHFHHPAQKFLVSFLDQYHLVLAMDQGNYDDIRYAAAGHPNLNRLHKFRAFDPEGSEADDVPDPYYGGDQGFELVYQMVDRTCDALIDYLEKLRQQTH
ncbi:low molecular weight protein-tyrosine-phosphatase [Spirochaeta africana]|uniref:protein-tyrosine-phosphatase n=1 Tax=Spirochaeta africana (strain ATCC 700263 / DSM 8902 / Z-7692) TaxID=889378 RepID=H9ULR1_SPIAZ|nr:low molecular weight protein-tyrosine-phosphatase [Spirochaeta africana]AFG38454.1 protein-tyrosine-phosphatase [Spirochaeta africana DSM 8902]